MTETLDRHIQELLKYFKSNEIEDSQPKGNYLLLLTSTITKDTLKRIRVDPRPVTKELVEERLTELNHSP